MSGLITLSDHRAYHLYRKETEMRKGFNLLCGIILNELGRQVTRFPIITGHSHGTRRRGIRHQRSKDQLCPQQCYGGGQTKTTKVYAKVSDLKIREDMKGVLGKY